MNSDPAFYTENFHGLTTAHDPFADNESLREAQMWTDFSRSASPEELAALKSDPILNQGRNLAFVDSAANTDYVLSLMNRGDKAMDRHLEDAVYGEGEKMTAQIDPRNNRSLKKILKLYHHLAMKSAQESGRSTPTPQDKAYAKAVISRHAAALSGMGHGLPTEILGGDYGPGGIGASPRKKPAPSNRLSQLAALKARRDAAQKSRAQKIAALRAAQAKKKADDNKRRSDAQSANRAKTAQGKKTRLDAMAQKREAAKKRKAAALLRAEASKKRKLAQRKPRPGKPSGSPMTVSAKKGKKPAGVTMSNRAPGQDGEALDVRPAPGSDAFDPPEAESLEASVPDAEPGETPAPEAEDQPGQASQRFASEEQAPEMNLTENETEAAEADAEATEAQAEAQDADADADETEASDEEVEPSELSGDFIGAVSEEKTKLLKAASQKNASGAKIRAGMTVYRKVKSGDPRAKKAVVQMAKRAEGGDKQAKNDLLAVKVGKLAQNQLVAAKQAYANLKKAAARTKGYALLSLLKTSAMKAKDRFRNAVLLHKNASQGNKKALSLINTVNLAAQAGDESAIRAQKNLALAALFSAHATADKEAVENDAQLVNSARSRLMGADARRQLAMVAAAASKGDKPSQHRMQHFALASMILDMFDGKDYKVTPARILKAGGKLPAVPGSVKAAAATLVAARKGNQQARDKLQNTARSALSGNLYAMRMMGDVALVGAMVAQKKGRALHPRIKEASKIVAKAKQGDPQAKRTILRASIAAKKGDKEAVAAMVALTAANTAQKAGGIPVQAMAPAEQANSDLLPLGSLPGPLQSIASGIRNFFGFYREGVSSRSRD